MAEIVWQRGPANGGPIDPPEGAILVRVPLRGLVVGLVASDRFGELGLYSDVHPVCRWVHVRWFARLAEIKTPDEDESPRGDSPKAGLTGEIKVGDRLIWEPTDPKTRNHVIVTNVEIDESCGRSEMFYRLRDRGGVEGWYEEYRVREACVRGTSEEEN